jgi:hypothetical protein
MQQVEESMDAAEFFMLRYDALHGVMTDRLFAGLSDAQLRARPHGQNSVVWLLWHVARGEDIGVNRFAEDCQEVFDEGAWARRIGVKRRDVGTGMTSDEVFELTGQVDIPAMREYWAAVGKRTVDVVRNGAASRWDEVVSPERIRRILQEEGDFGPNANPERLETFYRGMTRGWAFAHFALTHSYGHFYEANVVRGMLGFPGP